MLLVHRGGQSIAHIKIPYWHFKMGKVWLEALLPDGQMAKWIEPAETLAAEDVNAARDTTRVPAIIDDPPLVDRAAESFEKSRQQ